jgi:hypothetical protein
MRFAISIGMRKLYFAFIGFLLTLSLSVFAFAQGATASGQDGMESALSGVQNINDLLNYPERLERYYNEVNNYYQGKINLDIFNIMIEQMKTLAKENPEFGVRLLKENVGVPSYAVVSDVKTYGRDLNIYSWNNFRSDTFGTKTDLPWDAKKKLEKISKEISDFEKNLEGNKKDQGIKRGEFYKNLKLAHAMFAREVVGAIYNSDPLLKDLQHSNDPDLVIYSIDTVLKERLAHQGFPENTLSLLSSAIPRASDLLANPTVFPVATAVNKRGVEVPVEPMSSTTYKFDTFKRPLHAVWKGIWLSECVGGGNSSPTPRRWATVVMKNVNNYAVEKNGSFVGFVQELGMQKKGTPRMVYATEFGTPNLKEDILVMDPKTKAPRKRKMIDVWLEKVPKNIVRVKSESNAINNANVIDSLQGSETWNNRRSRGDASEFEFADQKLADFITKASHQHNMEPTHKYGDGIISDGSVPDAKHLTAIKNTKWTEKRLMSFVFSPSLTFENVLEMIERNPEFIEQMGVDEFVRKYYSANIASDPMKILKMAKHFYSKNPDILQEYRTRLMAATKDSFIKLKMQETITGVDKEKSVEFSKTLPWTSEEISRYLLSRDLGFYSSTKEQINYLSKLALQNKMVAAYPAVAKFGWRYFLSGADRNLILSSISELGPEHKEIAKEALKQLFRNIKAASSPNQETVFELAQKYGLLAELRAEAPKYHENFPDFSFKGNRSFTVSQKYIEQMLLSAVADKDIGFLKIAINSNYEMDSYVEKKKNMANLVSYIIRSKDLKLISLIADEKVVKEWRQIPNNYLRNMPAEAAAYRDLVQAADKAGGITAIEMAERIAGIEVGEGVKEVKVVAAAKSAKPVKAAPAAAAVPAGQAPPVLPEGNFSADLRPLLTALFAAEGPGDVDTAQRRIQTALGDDHYPSRESVAMIRAYLTATTPANLESRAYHVLALFEIAAMTPNMPSELYRSSKVLAAQVLNLPDFRPYQPNYAELLRAQKVDTRAPLMCQAVFGRGA